MHASPLCAVGEPSHQHDAGGADSEASARKKADLDFTANDWLPNAKDAAADAEKHIPSIVKGVLAGAASGDWHRLCPDKTPQASHFEVRVMWGLSLPRARPSRRSTQLSGVPCTASRDADARERQMQSQIRVAMDLLALILSVWAG